MSRSRQGKIARLPRVIREVVNHRLADGQPAAEILAWVNAQPKVRDVLARHFDGEDISPQNLSIWKSGGFADWLKTQEKEESIRSLADYSFRLAEAGGKDLSAGAVAIAAGKIYEVLESVAQFDEDGTDEGKGEVGVIDALAKLRSLELDARRVDQRDQVIAIAKRKQASKEREVELAERRFQTLAVETFIKWAKSEEARKILNAGASKHVQIARLRELMFGPSLVQDSAP
jgi:hypothetical protein